MKRTKPLALVAAVLVALVALLSGCGGEDDAPNAPTMLQGSWTLETLGGSAADAAVPTTLSMNNGEATGNAGVNTFNGSYDAPSDGVLTFGPLATTMMAGPDNAMQQEQAFLKALADTKKFTTEDGALVLMDDGETKLAVLKAAGNG
ncbi:MAG TPA: META domain-containing protein [Ornithinibacter sp.]|nr:META domain-containing protein [Ornithinibacter sp.]